jgi:iron complex outermembrane recepter protein
VNPAQSPQDVELDEVIVTATKREERLRDVPFAITALTTRDLERIGATGEQDYLSKTPGVYFNGNGARGRGAIVIRGVATQAQSNQNQQRTVEKYLDELPLTDRFSTWTDPDISTFDIERVEVMRGPQGTLFGSGAMGGAVRLITNKPDPSGFRSKVELGLSSTRGGDDGNNAAGMVNVPLVQDKLAMRAVAYRREIGGFIDNLHRNEKNINGETATGGRLMFAYQPTEALKLGLNALYDHAVADDNAATFATTAGGASYQWNSVITNGSDAKLNIYNFTVDYEFGAATLTSISTYGKRDSFFGFGDPVRGLSIAVGGRSLDPDENESWVTHDYERFTQEVRLTSSGEGRLKWTVGAFFMDHSQDVDQFVELGPGPNLPVPDPNGLVALDDEINVATEEGAVFGEATYRLTDRLSVTAGARWFHNKFGVETIAAPSAFGSSTPFVEDTASALTPRASVSFFPRDDMHLYATASKGYRAGQANFNHGLDPVNIPVAQDPDSLWNYELGIKAGWWDNRLQTNIAAYHIDWSDIVLDRIITIPGPTGPVTWAFVDNGGNATIEGIEAEFVVRPLEALEIGTSLAYNDGELDSVIPGTVATAGSTLPGTPEFAISSYIQGNARLGNDIAGQLLLSHRHAGEVYGDIDNTNPDTLSDAYDVFDVRGSLTYQNYEVALYVENVLDNDAATLRLNTPFFDPAYRLRPRTMGLTFRASF